MPSRRGMRHRPAGTGTAYQEKATGLWVAERTVEGRRFRRKAQTRPLAMSRLDQAISAQDRGPADVTSDTTLAEYLRLWLPGYRDIRPKTRAGYRHAFEAYVIPLIGEVRVSELRTRHVAGVLRHMAQQGLSASTRRNTRNALSSALNAAVLRDEVAETNVAKGIRVPEGENRALNIVVSPARIKGFLRALEDHPHYHVWALTLYLVRRIGETVALRWEDFPTGHSEKHGDYPRIRGGVLTLRRNWSYVERPDGSLTAGWGKLKSKATYKQIPLPPEAQTLLFGLWRQRDKPARGLLFPSPRDPDRPISPSYTLRMMKQHLLAKGWDREDIPRQHDLRHWACTFLLSEGVALTTVSTLAGHANPEVTARIYAHVMSGDAPLAAAKLAFFPDSHRRPKPAATGV